MNKASANIRFYKNENGPVIGVTVRPVIEKDGLYFRDLTGDGRLAPYKDWRNTPAVRAASLAAELSADEKNRHAVCQFLENGNLPGGQDKGR